MRTRRTIESPPPRVRARSRAAVTAGRDRRLRRWSTAVALGLTFVAGVGVGSWSAGGQKAVAPDTARTVETVSPSSFVPDFGSSLPSSAEVAGSVTSVEEPTAPSSAQEPMDLSSAEGSPDASDTASGRSGTADFVTPSGNIICSYGDKELSCHIGSGLEPAPAGPCPGGTGEWSGISIGSAGPAEPWCPSEAFEDLVAPDQVLAYGSRWSRGGIVCTSASSGLRCVNDDDGELLLSRARAHAS